MESECYRNHQNKSNKEFSLSSTHEILEYEKHVDEREHIGFENDRDHKNKQNDALKCELASLEERDLILPVDSFSENGFKLGYSVIS